MQKTIIVTGIKWDADTKEELEGVSTTQIFTISTQKFKEFVENEDENGLEEFISDKITELSGFCHYGWNEYTVSDYKINLDEFDDKLEGGSEIDGKTPEEIKEMMEDADSAIAQLDEISFNKSLNRVLIYKLLYRTEKEKYLALGTTEDKSSRLANMFAVKNTEHLFFKYQSLDYSFC
jgi:hypothetical protein